MRSLILKSPLCVLCLLSDGPSSEKRQTPVHSPVLKVSAAVLMKGGVEQKKAYVCDGTYVIVYMQLYNAIVHRQLY